MFQISNAAIFINGFGIIWIFCSKYDSNPMLTTSFAGFDEKLQNKGQSET